MVTKEMTIGQLIAQFPNVAPVLMQIGMHCLGCPSASGETLEQACLVHGADVDKLVNDINEFLKSKE